MNGPIAPALAYVLQAFKKLGEANLREGKDDMRARFIDLEVDPRFEQPWFEGKVKCREAVHVLVTRHG